MAGWREYLQLGQKQAAQVPMLIWAVGGAIAASLAFVVWLETSAPPYTALYEGLSPADGGKVIAQLQKLGIPYQLQAAGNIILVPVPELSEARLQLGAAQIPQTGVTAGWDKLENAPMTTSDLAQSTMAAQALEASLQQSIETLNGIHTAQVYIALPADTPFLADQPKPTASVVIAADQQDAEAQGETIANLVAGAVPGLRPHTAGATPNHQPVQPHRRRCRRDRDSRCHVERAAGANNRDNAASTCAQQPGGKNRRRGCARCGARKRHADRRGTCQHRAGADQQHLRSDLCHR
jgi:flagellar M-ring protein FliF